MKRVFDFENISNNIGYLSGPFIENKLFFVHIPKNAGTTITHNLIAPGLPKSRVYPFWDQCHETATQLNGLERLSDWNNFIFCRNPIDRFLSVYLWRLRKDELIKKSDMRTVIEMLEASNIQQPLPIWGWELDKQKLDRMFNTQTTWTNDRTIYAGKVESLGPCMLEVLTKNRIDPASIGVISSQWQCNRVFKHNRAQQDDKQKHRLKNELITILKDSPNLRNRFFDYYEIDYKTFKYDIPKTIKH